MKNIFKSYQHLPLHNKVLCAVYVLVILVLALVIPMKPAHAQVSARSGGHDTARPAQVNQVLEAVVLSVAVREVSQPGHEVPAGLAGLIAGALRLASLQATTAGTLHDQEVVLRLVTRGGASRLISVRQRAPYHFVYPQECVSVTYERGLWRISPPRLARSL